MHHRNGPARSGRHSLTRRLGAVVAALGVTASASSVAAAAQPEVAHFTGSFGGIDQEDGYCLEVPFPIHYEFWFNNIVRVNTGSDGVPYVTLKIVNLGTITNLDTGESFTMNVAFRQADERIVDNGDGTYTVFLGVVGTTVVRSSGGGVHGIDAGRTEVAVLLDDNGTPADVEDDTVLSDVVGYVNGIRSLPEYCTYVAEILG